MKGAVVVLDLVCTAEFATTVRPDDLSSALLGHGTVALTDAFTSPINSSLISSPIPDCWGPITVAALLKRPLSPVYPPDDPSQSAYKSNRSTLIAIAPLIDQIYALRLSRLFVNI